jgi:protein-tyrosine phosphatase
LDIPYPDGGIPPGNVLDQFLDLCLKEFGNLRLDSATIAEKNVTIIDNPKVIAVHCVAGLGRAPVVCTTNNTLEACRKCEAGGNPKDYRRTIP